ncbi:MAG: hypothetical protein ABI947_01145 [Chloroflexota bacterium]
MKDFQTPPLLRLKFENGIFVPLDPIATLQEGDVLEFRLPDPNTVYLCETDRLAALESGRVVLAPTELGSKDSG